MGIFSPPKSPKPPELPPAPPPPPKITDANVVAAGLEEKRRRAALSGATNVTGTGINTPATGAHKVALGA